jgi:hypothetical protein
MQNRTVTTRQEEQDRQSVTGSMGEAEWERQNRTGRTRQEEQDRRNKKGKTGHLDWDR